MNLAHPVVLFSIAAAAVLALFGMRFTSPTPAPAELTGPRNLPELRQPLLPALEIEGTRTIGEQQTVTTIRIPDPQLRHNRHFDRYCVIYEHTEYRSVSVICDGSLSVSGNNSGNNW